MNQQQQVIGLVSQQAASAKIPFDAPDVEAKTYVSHTPHSSYIDPLGIKHVFVPNKNPRLGEITTTSPHLQAELDAAIRKGAPIRVAGNDEPAPKVFEKTAAERAAEMLPANVVQAKQEAYIVALEAKLADLVSGKITPEQFKSEIAPKEGTGGKLLSGTAASSTPSAIVQQAAADAKKRLLAAQEQTKEDQLELSKGTEKVAPINGVRG